MDLSRQTGIQMRKLAAAKPFRTDLTADELRKHLIIKQSAARKQHEYDNTNINTIVKTNVFTLNRYLHQFNMNTLNQNGITQRLFTKHLSQIDIQLAAICANKQDFVRILQRYLEQVKFLQNV